MALLFEGQGVREKMDWKHLVSLCLVLVALAAVVQFLALASIRVRYPFELEWIEGAYVDEARQVMAGRSLYSPPSISFIPLNKTPLFFVLSGMLMRITGAGFLAPRLISILATGACFALLTVIVAEESGHLAPGIIAGGVYAMAFRFAGAWMDLAKTDSLFLCLILGAFFISLRCPNYLGMIVSGICYTLAYYTKQTALSIVLVAAPISLLVSRGRTWPQWTVVGTLTPLIFLVLDARTDGWFSFYTFDALPYHQRVSDYLRFWRLIVGRLWPALLLGFLYPVGVLVDRGLSGILKMESPWQHLGFCVALLAASWSVYFKVWTYENGLMPAILGLAMLVGLGYAHGVKLARDYLPLLLRGIVPILVLCQFVLLAYHPLEQIPTHDEYSTWRHFIDRIRKLSGEVLVLNHGFVNDLAGKRTHLHSSPYGDIVGWAYPPRSEEHRWRRDMCKGVLEQAIAQQSFSWIVSGGSTDRWLPYYLLSTNEPFVAPLLTGAPPGSEFFFVRNPILREGEFPLTEATFDFLLDEGWSTRENWGRWATGKSSSMRVALEEGSYTLTLEMFPFCAGGFESQAMEVGWNDQSLGEYEFGSCEDRHVQIELPSHMVSGGLDTLWFEFEQATSPSDAGLSGDRRELSAGFTSVTFARAED